jgi:hypothetical protein
MQFRGQLAFKSDAKKYLGLAKGIIKEIGWFKFLGCLIVLPITLIGMMFFVVPYQHTKRFIKDLMFHSNKRRN